MSSAAVPPRALRSRAWFDNPDNADMTALYLERYLNFGLSLDELQSGKPIIGIAQTGSDLSPCNRHHLVLAEQVLQQAPTERFALAGHSMGGRVALEVCRLAPQRVERVALLDTGYLPIPLGEAGARLMWRSKPWQHEGATGFRHF